MYDCVCHVLIVFDDYLWQVGKKDLISNIKNELNINELVFGNWTGIGDPSNSFSKTTHSLSVACLRHETKNAHPWSLSRAAARARFSVLNPTAET